MEANAALRGIVRRDNGETSRTMLERMAKESGIATPNAEDLARFDRKRKGKKLSNDDWTSATDAEAKIARRGASSLTCMKGARGRQSVTADEKRPSSATQAARSSGISMTVRPSATSPGTIAALPIRARAISFCTRLPRRQMGASHTGRRCPFRQP